MQMKRKLPFFNHRISPRPSSARGNASITNLPPNVFTVAAITLFTLSILKGLRLPNLWAVTQLTYNYSRGFVRRGLVGELIRLAGGGSPYRYNLLAAVCFVFFAGASVAVAVLLKRTARKSGDSLEYRLSVLVFASSPGVVFLVHIIGYLDFILLAGTAAFLTVVLSGPPKRRYACFYLAAATAVLLTLVHESFLVLLFPAMVFGLICRMVRWTDDHPFSIREQIGFVVHLSLTIFICMLSTWFTSKWGTLNPEDINALIASISKSSTFPIPTSPFVALSRQPDNNLFSLMPPVLATPRYQSLLKIGLLMILPGFAVLLYQGITLSLRIHTSAFRRWGLMTAFIGASLAPILMNLVGWDAPRWYAFAVVSSFFCISSMQMAFSSDEKEARIRPLTANRLELLVILATIAIPLGVLGDNRLFDGAMTQLYPFEKLFEFVHTWVQNDFSYIPTQ